jgi:predicted aldo/keto reductase-like oxidoreductase
MQYRKFGKAENQISALGFGCMRLPTIGGLSSDINIEETEKMLRVAIDNGVNYFDTAYPYHGGNSETVVGNFLSGGDRDRVWLATKLPGWLVKEEKDFDQLLNEQLCKLKTDHIDNYLLHALNQKSWRRMYEMNIMDWAEKVKKAGKINHIGFSFHDNFIAFKEIIDAYEKWDFCQIQYNYMDIEHQAGEKGLKYAASKGLAIIIMEPLLGGRLANPPKSIKGIFESFPNQKTPVQWAFDWLWNQPEISVVLSGMTTMPQVIENIQSANDSAMKKLRDDELKLFNIVRTKYEELCPIPCTQCGYCLPCTNNLPISKILDIFNRAVMHEDIEGGRREYKFLADNERAENCSQCGECEELCPQQIPISQWMTNIDEILAQRKPMESITHG